MYVYQVVRQSAVTFFGGKEKRGSRYNHGICEKRRARKVARNAGRSRLEK